MMKNTNESLLREFLIEGIDDCIGLYEITKRFSSSGSKEEHRDQIMMFIEEMLNTGHFCAGEWDGDFLSWNLGVTESLEKILKQWSWENTRPQKIEMEIWFGLTSEGVKYAQAIRSGSGNG